MGQINFINYFIKFYNENYTLNTNEMELKELIIWSSEKISFWKIKFYWIKDNKKFYKITKTNKPIEENTNNIY